MIAGSSARRPIVVALGVVLAGVLLATSGTWLHLAPAATQLPPSAAADPSIPATTDGSTAPASSPSLQPSPSPAASAAARPMNGNVDVAVVPAVGFRSAWTSTGTAEVADILAGKSKRYAAIELSSADRDAILEVLGASSAALATSNRIRIAADAARLVGDLTSHADRLGFVRADDVRPAIRALAWEGRELFGGSRARTLADWPLTIRLPEASASSATPYNPATAWSMVAGGDINLDGAVAFAVKDRGLGVDYPWAGGTAEITSRYCCSRYGFELAQVRRTGNTGAVAALLSGADLAIANFENPAPNAFTYHRGGFTFSADPALIEGLKNTGIDWVSLANNHIGDAGGRGVVETAANLDRWGIAHGGAGANLREARAPSLLRAGDSSVAILAYDTIRADYAAGPSRAGSNQMTVARVTDDVAAARAAGADVVIVFPHWGVEYTAQPTKLQRALAHAAIDAGADLVLGNHTHWVGAMEVYRGHPIVYSLADFVFNIDRSEKTMEGILVETTYAGSRLVQLRIHPFFVVDRAQPNLLDPAGSGGVVLEQLFGASKGLLPW